MAHTTTNVRQHPTPTSHVVAMLTPYILFQKSPHATPGSSTVQAYFSLRWRAQGALEKETT